MPNKNKIKKKNSPPEEFEWNEVINLGVISGLRLRSLSLSLSLLEISKNINRKRI